MKNLYPEIEPYATHYLEVDAIHRLYVEECGNRYGLPVIFLHGGPGSGCKLHHRRFFNPKRYRIVLLDQRGSGRSMPQGELRHNTTWDLVEDLERIREKLAIDRWLLFGGSWGATLALLYAQKYPDNVLGMILRGVFLARQRDLDWYIKEGVSRIYPEQWQSLIASIPKADRDDPIEAVYQCLRGTDELAQRRIAREWELWGARVTLGSAFDPRELEEQASIAVLHKARIETHYARHRYFIEENQILRHCERILEIPTIIIHGRNDLVCPPECAYTLYRRLPRSELRILPHAGHIASGDEMIDALVSAADQMADSSPNGG